MVARRGKRNSKCSSAVVFQDCRGFCFPEAKVPNPKGYSGMKNGFRSIVFQFLLLAILSSGMAMAQCPNGKTNVILVNGILTPTAARWSNRVAGIGEKFFATHPKLIPACIEFVAFYNQSNGRLSDAMESAQFAVNIADLGPYLADLDKLTDPANGPYPLIGMGSVVSGYTEAVVSGRLQGPLNARPQDYKDLVSLIKTKLQAHEGVILIGHSEGNYYVNYAYQEIVADKTAQAQWGISLPNLNWLSVVGIANPSNFSADGRYNYITDCNDIIQVVPQHLPANSGNAVNCAILDLISGPLTAAEAASLYVSWRSAVDPLKTWKDLVTRLIIDSITAISLPHYVAYAGRLWFAARTHSLDAYMADGSNSQKQIYQLLESSIDLSVSRGAVPPPPVLTATCFANPAIITAGQSTVFSGSSAAGGGGVIAQSWGGVVSGSFSTATYATSSSAPAGIGKATYTVSDNSSPKQTAVANCQVQVNASVSSYTATPPTQSVNVMVGQSVSADVIFSGKDNPAITANLPVYCIRQTGCPGGFSYNLPPRCPFPRTEAVLGELLSSPIPRYQTHTFTSRV